MITFTNDSASISTSEYSLPNKSTTSVPIATTTQGKYQFFVDLSNLAAGDQYRFRLYEKYDSGGTARLIEEWIFTNAQSKPMFVTPEYSLGQGWDFTGLKLAGTDRTILWSLRNNNAMNFAVEGTTKFVEAVRLMLAVLTGKSSGGSTSTLVFRDIGDSKNRISCTVDANGNRTAVGTRDGS